jgi:hypothetical protein
MEKVKKIIDKIKQNDKEIVDMVDWKEFKLSEIFETEGNGGETIIGLNYGNINLISSSGNNNGVSKKVNSGKLLFDGNKLTLAKNGSVGIVYYQKNNFYATSDIMILKNNNLNDNIGIFLKVMIERETKKFDWSNKINLQKYNNINILLPSTNNQPDWEYMEQYILNLKEKMRLRNMERMERAGYDLVLKIIDKIKQNNREIVDMVDWKEFKISDIFNCDTAEQLLKTKEGNFPYVSRSAINNGINKYIKKEDKYINKGNCITIGAEGRYAFYQGKDFMAGNKIYILRNKKINKNNSLFICAILNSVVNKYSYSNARILEKIKNELHFLPSKNDQPDWEYMEQYILNLKECY